MGTASSPFSPLFAAGSGLECIAAFAPFILLSLLAGRSKKSSPPTSQHFPTAATATEQVRKDPQEYLRLVNEAKRKQADEQRELRKLDDWRRYHESLPMDQLDKLTGKQFEAYLARLLAETGYTSIEFTGASADQGADILCEKEGIKWAVQAKRWAKPVGNKAVQEILGGMRFYGRERGMVITTTSFTAPAVELAQKDGTITLCDRTWLAEQIKAVFSSSVPEFDQRIYELRVRPWADQLTRQASSAVRTGRTAKRRWYRRRRRW